MDDILETKMSGGVKMATVERERMQIRLSKFNVDRLNEISERYGMSSNSLVSYIIGVWLDNNFDLKDQMREKMIGSLTDPDKLKIMMGGLTEDVHYQKILEMAFKEGMGLAMSEFGGDPKGIDEGIDLPLIPFKKDV